MEILVKFYFESDSIKKYYVDPNETIFSLRMMLPKEYQNSKLTFAGRQLEDDNIIKDVLYKSSMIYIIPNMRGD